MNSTHAWISSVSNRSKLSDPPGKCCTAEDVARLRMDSRRKPSTNPDSPFPMGVGCSRTRGVSAPLALLPVERLEDEHDRALGASSDGEEDLGVDMLLEVLEPWDAAIEGDEGGSGERVK